MLTNSLCVKYGRYMSLDEAHSMVFIARSTKVPVPRVYMAFTLNGCTYVLMERIQGRMLAQGWFDRSPESRAKVLEDLKAKVNEMRSLAKQDYVAGGVTGGPVEDPRMLRHGRFGPFRNVKDFHDFLRDGIEANENHTADLHELVELHNQRWDAPTFTHGDLSSLNILARGDDIVGIVDWHTAGWFPSYWEYTTASQVNPQNSFWKDEIDKFLEPMPTALKMEQLRQKYFGDF